MHIHLQIRIRFYAYAFVKNTLRYCTYTSNVFFYENSLKIIFFRLKIYVFSQMNTFTFNVFLLSSNFFNNFSLKKIKILDENKNTLIVIVFIYENSLKKNFFLLKNICIFPYKYSASNVFFTIRVVFVNRVCV